MADLDEIGLLFDFYGLLLTRNQRRCIEMYYSDDMSLTEIADELGVSRQGAYDTIRRGRNLLEHYESKLRLVRRFINIKKQLGEIDAGLTEIGAAASNVDIEKQIDVLRKKVADIVGEL